MSVIRLKFLPEDGTLLAREEYPDGGISDVYLIIAKHCSDSFGKMMDNTRWRRNTEGEYIQESISNAESFGTPS